MRQCTAVLGVILLAMHGMVVHGQEKLTEHTLAGEKGSGTLNDVSWMQGHWIGSGLGGACEEIVGQPSGGAMIGAFRYSRDEKLQFTEHFVIFEQEGSLTLKLKHFDSEMKGWEERDKFVEFKLIKLEPKAAYFHGLTYRLNDDDSMDVFVLVINKDGTKREERLQFKRLK